MSDQAFLNGRVRLLAGDCLDRIKGLPDASIDSVCTDPPYGLSFMGKGWDSSCAKQVAFNLEFWAEVFRVLKPGGHVLAFGGTRTVHRLTCAIEDAGFEIRDMVAWVYGSGFPKSLDVSKAIDKRGGAQVGWFGPWFRKWRLEQGISSNAVAKLFPSKNGGKTGCVRNWELGLNLPTPEQYNLICRTFNLPFASISEAEREVVGRSHWSNSASHFVPGEDHSVRVTLDVTAPATDAARQWEGWGTALKPALEPITLARKPLIGTVAANVLAHGTGALNVDGCRVPTGESLNGGAFAKTGTARDDGWGMQRAGAGDYRQPVGRFPANLIHDGSDEVVGAFPESAGQQGDVRGTELSEPLGLYTFGRMAGRVPAAARKDTGSAARFFYSAKADSDDRIGSKHPTVKPVDLMRYLVRLVTPPGGTVLDPFAGTGTTGEAAFREGFRAVLIEREEDYRADIARRMDLVMAGPDGRKHAIIKAKAKPDDFAGTLFAEAAE